MLATMPQHTRLTPRMLGAIPNEFRRESETRQIDLGNNKVVSCKMSYIYIQPTDAYPKGEFGGAEMIATISVNGVDEDMVSVRSYLSENDRKMLRSAYEGVAAAAAVCEIPELTEVLTRLQQIDFELNALSRSLYGFASHQHDRVIWFTGIMDKLAYLLGFHTHSVKNSYADGVEEYVVNRQFLRGLRPEARQPRLPLHEELQFRAMMCQAWIPSPELAAKLEQAHEKSLVFKRKTRVQGGKGMQSRRDAQAHVSNHEDTAPVSVRTVEYNNKNGRDELIVDLMSELRTFGNAILGACDKLAQGVTIP